MQNQDDPEKRQLLFDKKDLERRIQDLNQRFGEQLGEKNQEIGSYKAELTAAKKSKRGILYALGLALLAGAVGTGFFYHKATKLKQTPSTVPVTEMAVDYKGDQGNDGKVKDLIAEFRQLQDQYKKQGSLYDQVKGELRARPQVPFENSAYNRCGKIALDKDLDKDAKLKGILEVVVDTLDGYGEKYLFIKNPGNISNLLFRGYEGDKNFSLVKGLTDEAVLKGYGLEKSATNKVKYQYLLCEKE